MQQGNGLMFTDDQSIYSGGAGPAPRITGTVVRFYTHSVQNPAKTAAEGRPIYDPVEYVEIRNPGDKTNVVNRAVREQDRREFAQQYAQWKAGNETQMVGTPLALWPPASAEVVLELQHFGCRTVEQLAEMTDANLGNVGPFRTLREQAKAWLEAARGAAPLLTMQDALRAKDEEVAGLRQQVADLQRAMGERKGK